jgi:ubiquinone/menaquinone biosynthesis C-methylase UbiE
MDPAELYLRVRDKEGRLYPDETVAHLPDLRADHPHKVEWLARADSTNRLIHYLMGLHSPLLVLELGCGNGWLSHNISAIPGMRIWGLDRGSLELTQAARLFSAPNTGFISANIFQSPFVNNSFDVIILASVIQYFKDLPALIVNLQSLLTKRGEIHLIDSPIYRKKDVISARERTVIYYNKLGFPKMADYYFHHTTDELNKFRTRWLYQPGGWQPRLTGLLGKTVSPFPWLYIR